MRRRRAGLSVERPYLRPKGGEFGADVSHLGISERKLAPSKSA